MPGPRLTKTWVGVDVGVAVFNLVGVELGSGVWVAGTGVSVRIGGVEIGATGAGKHPTRKKKIAPKIVIFFI